VGNEKRIIFDPFCLDLASEQLWKGSQAIKLRPKAFAVLDHLLGRPGQLVTKDDLLNAVWPGTFVSDAVLKVAIRQLREALDDDPRSPRFIETAHRRGYRFIGQIAHDDQGPAAALLPSVESVLDPLPAPVDLSLTVVGRDKALSRLQSWLKRIRSGERQLVFVTGEAGIGKTALVDLFARSIASQTGIRVGRGQCLAQYGTGEAYLPVLEAIGQLCREQGQAVVEVLRAHAPMWLLQMPSLVSAADRQLLGREVLGATRERMLREMGEALEVLTAERPLVLILEDLHWSDYSTLDLISYLARKRRPAQLMLIGTFRTVELIVSGHPLKAVKQELLAKQQCQELPLEYLSEPAVARYLAVRFPAHTFPPALARLIHERTEGHPLFMVNVVDYLLAERLLRQDKENWTLAVAVENVELGVPDSIKQIIEKQLDHLDGSEQRTLEAASVAGAEFSSPAVVAALEEDRTAVEARCDELARRRQFLQHVGVHVLPDGEAVSRYSFTHALYRKVLYERASTSRRVQLHRRIAERGEVLFGERAKEIAGELAMHFEQGADYKQAARYFQLAADTAVRRFAYREAVALSRHGLELLLQLPESPERDSQELSLQLTLGVPLIATEGYASPHVGKAYLRARELFRQSGDNPAISEVLWGLWTFHIVSGQLAIARKIGEEFLSLAERLPYPGLKMWAHMVMEITFLHMGSFAAAMEHFEKAFALYNPERHVDDAFFYALNPGVAMRCFAAWALWFLGEPEQSLHRIQEALKLARDLSEPHGLAHAHLFVAILHQLRREARMALVHAEVVLAIAKEHGLVMYEAMANVVQGWAVLEQGRPVVATEQMRQGLAALEASGTELVSPHYMGLLSEALARAQAPDEGLRVLEKARVLAQSNGERYYEAELYRLKGELILAKAQAVARPEAVTLDGPGIAARAEAFFEQSLQIARNQKARAWELRTALSLARLYQRQRKREKARTLLAGIYEQFTEGFDTVDLQEAKRLLEELSQSRRPKVSLG